MKGVDAADCYFFRDMFVPDYMMPGIKRWIEQGVEPGDFLRAVLRNDLREAVGRADDTNIRNLPAFVAYLYNRAPSQCWGSPEKYDAWIEWHAKHRAAEVAQ